MKRSVLRALITGEAALRVCDGALAKARAEGQSVVVAVVDASGIVWVATSGGLSRLDPTTGLIVNFTGDELGSTTSDIRSIFIDAQGVKWLGTASGILRYAGT